RLRSNRQPTQLLSRRNPRLLLNPRPRRHGQPARASARTARHPARSMDARTLPCLAAAVCAMVAGLGARWRDARTAPSCTRSVSSTVASRRARPRDARAKRSGTATAGHTAAVASARSLGVRRCLHRAVCAGLTGAATVASWRAAVVVRTRSTGTTAWITHLWARASHQRELIEWVELKLKDLVIGNRNLQVCCRCKVYYLFGLRLRKKIYEFHHSV
ncbi:hypothetical protein L916_08798, partial [Phytophthora nicotianae]